MNRAEPDVTGRLVVAGTLPLFYRIILTAVAEGPAGTATATTWPGVWHDRSSEGGP